SCGVIPVSASIRRHGASKAATTSFLLSTPQTGVDSIAVTYALLGPIFAIFRPIVALLTGLIGGGIVILFGEPNRTDATVASNTITHNKAACCAGKHRPGVLLRVLRYGLLTLPRDIGLALLVGVLLAGVMAVLVPQDHLSAYIGGGVLSIIVLMAAGVPVYVCATASVPIAAGFMHMGASPGAALAFLIAGPATNAATFTTIWKVLGRRTAILYIVTIAVSAFGCGLLLNWMIPMLEGSLPMLDSSTHAHLEDSWWYHIWAIVLLAVLTLSCLRRKTTVDEDTNNEKRR
ncbi:MAG: permease, partial [Sedimentisphaerales bacterium]|nr:permease [Sedimentisphaerales bacterium]